MELDEMKTLWNEMSLEMEKQKKLTDMLIIKMTKADFRNKFNKLLISDAIAAVICYAAFFFILINMRSLNTWYLLVCGIVSALILCLSPIFSLRSIYKMRSVDILNNNYSQSISEYAKAKIQFVFGQKLSIYLGAVLLLATLPVAFKLVAGKDVFKYSHINIWYIYLIAFPFVLWPGRWIVRYYIKTATDAENILKELDS